MTGVDKGSDTVVLDDAIKGSRFKNPVSNFPVFDNSGSVCHEVQRLLASSGKEAAGRYLAKQVFDARDVVLFPERYVNEYWDGCDPDCGGCKTYGRKPKLSGIDHSQESKWAQHYP